MLPLFQEILGHYEGLLGQTLGDDLPPPPEPPKRKPRPAKALEMAATAWPNWPGPRPWTSPPSPPASGSRPAVRRILADPDLLHRAAREVSTMVEILAKLPGARPTDDLVDPMDVLDEKL